VAGADFPQFGLDFTTDIAEVRLATRVEAAAGGRVERAWDLAAKNDLRAFPLDVKRRACPVRGGPARQRGTTLASYIQTFSSARGVQSIQLATP